MYECKLGVAISNNEAIEERASAHTVRETLEAYNVGTAHGY